MRIKIRKALQEIAQQEFQYGVMDCCQFTAYIVNAIHGVDYIKPFKYNSEVTAYQIVNKKGGLAGLLRSILGKPGDYGEGDPVLMKAPVIGEFVGIYVNGKALAKCKHGVVPVDKRYIVEGWPICHKQSQE